MYILYIISNNESDSLYIGMTSQGVVKRWSAHKHAAKSGKKSKLYDAIRKYGEEVFNIVEIAFYENKEDCCKAEINTIRVYRDLGINLYNLANGGEGGYVVPEHLKGEWRAKLSLARQGRKPALGMKHTEENKKFFSECSKRRVLLYPDLDVTKIRFIEANKLYGISRTHYYRLLKRAKSNNLS